MARSIRAKSGSTLPQKQTGQAVRQLLPEVLAELSLGSGKSGLSFKLSDLFPGLRRGLCPPPLPSPFWLLLCIHSVKVIPLTVSSTTMYTQPGRLSWVAKRLSFLTTWMLFVHLVEGSLILLLPRGGWKADFSPSIWD